MKYFIALIIFGLQGAAYSATTQINYDLEVSGMVCAFCAYNVSKQLQSIDGVIADSVEVDLAHGAVVLRSATELDEKHLAELISQAGFTVVAITKMPVLEAESTPPPEMAVLLSVTLQPAALAAGEFEEVLEGLGALAERRSGRIHVRAPDDLEETILKPLLGGRKTVISVVYDTAHRADQGVIVLVLADSALDNKKKIGG